MIKLGIGYLPDDVIIEHANTFLKNHHNVTTIPVPIEEIIDLAFDIDIIPLPGIQKLCDVEGFITPDFKAIYVDQYIYNHRHYRFRFTLAHEIGHLIIHKEKLENVKIDETNVIESWSNFLEQLDNVDHGKMEYQGYSFGGFVLVPQARLMEEFKLALPRIEPLVQEAKSVGASRYNYIKYAIDQMATFLSPVFDVSTGVLTRRIKFDNLDGLIP